MANKKQLIYLFLLLFALQKGWAQTGSLTVSTWISEAFKHEIKPAGRIFLFVSKSRRYEPRLSTWPGNSNKIYATNTGVLQEGRKFTFCAAARLTSSTEIPLDKIPEGKYSIQVLWDQNQKESGINAAGNFYSEPILVEISGDVLVELPLEKKTKPVMLANHELLREFNIRSEVLSSWWGKEMRLKAAVLLPPDYYSNPDHKYPIRYNIAGYGGRYTRANQLVEQGQPFLEWWQSNEAPRVINVFLDGEGPYGDCYQLDSENSGPYGEALTQELIPYIEDQFRAMGTPESRFLDGCSTGGWVSLALQLFYPDFFGGCFSYSPDPVDFENFQLINIYSDKNAFYNEYGYLRPLARHISGEPVISQKDFIRFENALGRSDTYVTSGGQFSAFTALFSPKGNNDLPMPLFDAVTGEIDHNVAEHWKKYDLKHYLENNWETVGPKIQGKIWIWMGDMDDFYLNHALRQLDIMLKNRTHPEADASIHFSPVTGHCSEYSHRGVLLQIKEKLDAR
jgi:S-formylglutathione hydrolase FrmB